MQIIDLIKVEVYDRFDGDTYKCRLEIFRGGKAIENRVMKYEGSLNEQFVLEAERRLAYIITNQKP
ncbi:MAG: hypothetical protein V7734_07050 [Maribacter arcticus]|uniref:hypothetical protein n=1 Tax=Maribacter arcticus TaxID=561365 RepID=UPI00300296A4